MDGVFPTGDNDQYSIPIKNKQTWIDDFKTSRHFLLQRLEQLSISGPILHNCPFAEPN